MGLASKTQYRREIHEKTQVKSPQKAFDHDSSKNHHVKSSWMAPSAAA